MPIEGAGSPITYFVPSGSPATPRDLIDPLALVLSEIIQVPTLGNPVVDELIGKIRTTARGNVQTRRSIVRPT